VYLNPILRGWANYFSWLNSGEHFHKIGRYVIQRLNRWNRRKQQRVQRRYRSHRARAVWARPLSSGWYRRAYPMTPHAVMVLIHSRQSSVSRMRENLTYGLMRGRWRTVHGLSSEAPYTPKGKG